VPRAHPHCAEQRVSSAANRSSATAWTSRTGALPRGGQPSRRRAELRRLPAGARRVDRGGQAFAVLWHWPSAIPPPRSAISTAPRLGLCGACLEPLRQPSSPTAGAWGLALLVGDEEPRYVELVWEERDEDLVGTLLIVTVSRVVRIGGLRRSLTSPGSNPGEDDAVQAEAWPLSRLRALRLSGSLRAWHGVGDSSPLPAGCAWLLEFDGHAEPLRLPISPNADRNLRH
jgi:hypothetical protein